MMIVDGKKHRYGGKLPWTMSPWAVANLGVGLLTMEQMCKTIPWFLSRVLWKVHSKDHAVTALSSRTTHRETITRSALHHYQGRNWPSRWIAASVSSW